MQNRYTGDIGDFGKYALLKALAGNDLRLGVHWYLNADEEGNTDGRLTDYPNLRECDPVLFEALHGIVNHGTRCVAAVERAGILPLNTLFYSTPLTFSDLPARERVARARRRGQWNASAVELLGPAHLVFMDPDTGIAGRSAGPISNNGPKYVFPEELPPYIRRGQSLIVYHHQTREKGGLTMQIESGFTMLRSLGVERPWAFVFHRKSVRVYFVVPAAAHERILAERSLRFIAGTWGRGRHFELRQPVANCAAL